MEGWRGRVTFKKVSKNSCAAYFFCLGIVEDLVTTAHLFLWKKFIQPGVDLENQ